MLKVFSISPVFPSLFFQVKGNGGDNDIFPVQQSGANQQAGLVMQKVVPAFFRDELRNEDGHLVIGFFGFPFH